ncbi:MAG TPA: HK97 gp10 family phage protein [Acidimicrobiia bacterium]|nr:HK97 gp10 family phage protein [Acidimicrobiia bacterium]
MPKTMRVQVDGPEELREALRGLSRALPGAARAEMADTAQMIARDAQGAVPRRSGAARASVRAEIRDGAAAIVAGGRRAPYFPWLEFGGRVGIRDSVDRPFVRDGRYIGRAVDAGVDDIEAAAARGFVEAARAQGLDVAGGT